ncbi:MAG: hypothetical protein O9318_16100 [Hylemonella sp.]|uniref:hypothetical protein n=1 Tax=Hylemonella sp. TaxID=2066020 RepID=UPI0022C32295|nr:hypothetical protein [Hylemonella sp.]MCZ8253990.1 hypothetical protein [Hylemonella sp.]
MSETSPSADADGGEGIYVPYEEFRVGLPAGRFRVIVNPDRARKYVKHRLLLTALILPIIGTGIGMAFYGYRWLGLGLVIFGVLAHRLVAHQAPKILLHMATQDAKIYHEALDFEILEVRLAR